MRILMLMFFIVSCTCNKKAKNIVFMIGDGMGVGHYSAARVIKHGADGSLNMEKLPNVALMKTYSLDHYITDSAASASSLATGIKTKNGYVGVNEKGQPLTNILVFAKSLGKSIGIVTTTRITHGTPAAYYAHNKDRNDEKNIATDLLNSPVDLIIGGGKEMFSDKLLSQLKQNNWQVLSSLDRSIDYSKKVIGLFSPDHMDYHAKKVEGRL